MLVSERKDLSVGKYEHLGRSQKLSHHLPEVLPWLYEILEGVGYSSRRANVRGLIV